MTPRCLLNPACMAPACMAPACMAPACMAPYLRPDLKSNSLTYPKPGPNPTLCLCQELHKYTRHALSEPAADGEATEEEEEEEDVEIPEALLDSDPSVQLRKIVMRCSVSCPTPACGVPYPSGPVPWKLLHHSLCPHPPCAVTLSPPMQLLPHDVHWHCCGAAVFGPSGGLLLPGAPCPSKMPCDGPVGPWGSWGGHGEAMGRPWRGHGEAMGRPWGGA